MSFSDKINNITKRPVGLVTIQLDTCTRTFGVSPCLATGEECYNTYPTCKYKTAFNKNTKDYDICSSNAPINMAAELNARPYLISESYMPTELSEEKTIPARATFTIADEPDTDVGIDPYLSSRTYDILTTPGTFIKKLLARNPNYKGRLVTAKQGFDGLTKAEFVQRFRGKIANIQRDRTNAKIECVDLLKSLDDYEYPIKLNAKITEDVGAYYTVESQEEMLELTSAKNGDYVNRTDFEPFAVTSELVSGSLEWAIYWYQVIAYTAAGDPIADSGLLQIADLFNPVTGVQLTWSAVTGAAYYRVYGRDVNMATYYQTTSTTFTDLGDIVFNGQELMPTEANRLFILSDDDPTNINNWTQLFTLPEIGITDTSLLDAVGYVQIEKEAVSYTSKDSTKIYGVRRAQGKTKGDARHYAGTNISAVIAKAPTNPFTILMDLFAKANITSDYYESTKLAAYRDAYTGINFSTLPIFTSTKLGKLVTDLVNVLDGKIWQNENGKLDFKYNSESTISATITDAENIILNSTGVDHSTDEIKTRLALSYNKYDATKNDKDNYQGIWVEVYPDAEGPNMYDEELLQEYTTTWVNEDCGTAANIKAYLAVILNAKLKRKTVSRPIFQCDVEIKDSGILVGQLVNVDCDDFNNIDGTNYTGKTFEVIKKEFKNSKLTLWLQYWPTDEITTESEDRSPILENPVPVSKTSLNEVKVSNLKYIDDEGNEIAASSITTSAPKFVSNRVKLMFDNMYMSEAQTATDIAGVTRSLPWIWVYTGYPPSPHHQRVDIASWKTVRQYNIYMFVPYLEATLAPTTPLPTADDPLGKWYKIAIMPDLKINDATKKYYFEFTVPPSLLGKYIYFDVYADARLVYDPNVFYVSQLGFAR